MVGQVNGVVEARAGVIRRGRIGPQEAVGIVGQLRFPDVDAPGIEEVRSVVAQGDVEAVHQILAGGV